MAESFNFELVSPEQLLVSAEVVSVVIPGSEGDMTVLAKHSPVMTTLRPGLVSVEKVDGQKEDFVVFGGFADILPTGCTVLAEAAYSQADLDKEMFEKRISEAQQARESATGDEEVAKLDLYVNQLTTLRGAILPA